MVLVVSCSPHHPTPPPIPDDSEREETIKDYDQLMDFSDYLTNSFEQLEAIDELPSVLWKDINQTNFIKDFLKINLNDQTYKNYSAGVTFDDFDFYASDEKGHVNLDFTMKKGDQEMYWGESTDYIYQNNLEFLESLDNIAIFTNFTNFTNMTIDTWANTYTRTLPNGLLYLDDVISFATTKAQDIDKLDKYAGIESLPNAFDLVDWIRSAKLYERFWEGSDIEAKVENENRIFSNGIHLVFTIARGESTKDIGAWVVGWQDYD